MEILNNFGFEPILFVAQIVNFLVIYLVLKKFLYKPILRLLDERKKKISDGLKNAEEAEKRLLEATEKEEKILKKAQTDAKKMMTTVIEESENQRALMLAETKKQVEEMIKDARDQIENDTAIAAKKLESQVSKIAIEFLEKSTNNLFDDNEQEIIMKKAIKKIKNHDK